MVVNTKKLKDIAWILPIICLYSLLIGGGLVKVFIESLGYIPALGLNEINWSSYYKVLTDESIYRSIIYAFYLAITSSFLSCIFGVLLAYRLTTSKSQQISGVVRRILRYGMILPYLYMMFISVLIFSRTGILSRLLFHFQLIDNLDQFPQLIYNNNGFGVILVFVAKGIPFVTLFVVNVMDKVNAEFQFVAATLGAGNLHRLRYLFLPLCSNAIIWSTIILFAYDLGAFEVPFLFLGQSAAPLSVKLYSAYIDPHIQMIPQTMAINGLLLFIGTVGTILYAYLLRKVILWQKKF